MERPEFLASKPVKYGKEAARKEGKSGRGKFAPTTPEDIARGLALRAEQSALGPTTQIGSHFIIDVEWLGAAIQEDEIHLTGRFAGYVYRPESRAEVDAVTATVRIPAHVWMAADE